MCLKCKRSKKNGTKKFAKYSRRMKLWQVYLIYLDPNISLSLQRHLPYADNWMVVRATAIVKRDGTEQLIAENQSTYIPLGCKHRLKIPAGSLWT